MKIKEQTTPSRTESSPDCVEFIEKLKKLLNEPGDELWKALQEFVTSKTTFKTSDLYNWIEILNSLDDKLSQLLVCLGLKNEQISNDTQSKITEDKQENCKKLVIILDFTEQLLQHSSSRALYNSYDHLCSVMSSEDSNLVLIGLRVLSSIVRRSMNIQYDDQICETLLNLSIGKNIQNPRQITILQHQEERELHYEYTSEGVTKIVVINKSSDTLPEEEALTIKLRMKYNEWKGEDAIQIVLQAINMFILSVNKANWVDKFVSYKKSSQLISEVLEILENKNVSVETHKMCVEVLHSSLASHQTFKNDLSQQVLMSLGLEHSTNHIIHKMFSDVTDGAPYLFLSEKTSQDQCFVEALLSLFYYITTNFKARINIYNEITIHLVKILETPQNLHYRFSLQSVAKTARILCQIMKGNHEDYSAVEKTIERLTYELKTIDIKDEEIQQNNTNQITLSQRQDTIRLLFRLLGYTIFKNDPNQEQFQTNYISASKKILQSSLFETYLGIQSSTDQIIYPCLTLLSYAFNDLPSQIPKYLKLSNLFIEKLIDNIPDQPDYFSAILKMITSVMLHKEGEQLVNESGIIDKLFGDIFQIPAYKTNFIKQPVEYNRLIWDFLNKDNKSKMHDLLLSNLTYLQAKFEQANQRFKESIEDMTKKESEWPVGLKQDVDEFQNLVDLNMSLLFHILHSDQHPGNVNKNAEGIILSDIQEAILKLIENPSFGVIKPKVFIDVTQCLVHEYLNCALPFSKKLIERFKSSAQNLGFLFQEGLSGEERIKGLINIKQFYIIVEMLRHTTSSIKLDLFLRNELNIQLIQMGQLESHVIKILADSFADTIENKYLVSAGEDSISGQEYKKEFVDHHESVNIEEHTNITVNGLSNSIDEVILSDYLHYSRAFVQSFLKIAQSRRRQQITGREQIVFTENMASVGRMCAIRASSFGLTELNKIFNISSDKEIEESINKMSHSKFTSQCWAIKSQLTEIHEVLFSMNTHAKLILSFQQEQGFTYINELFLWTIKTTYALEKNLKLKTKCLCSHLQQIWNQLGEFIATMFECKYLQVAGPGFVGIEFGQDIENAKDFFKWLFNQFLQTVFMCSPIIEQYNNNPLLLFQSLSLPFFSQVHRLLQQTAMYFPGNTFINEINEHTEDSTKILLDMGFNRSQAQQALSQCRTIEQAIDMCMQYQCKPEEEGIISLEKKDIPEDSQLRKMSDDLAEQAFNWLLDTTETGNTNVIMEQATKLYGLLNNKQTSQVIKLLGQKPNIISGLLSIISKETVTEELEIALKDIVIPGLKDEQQLVLSLFQLLPNCNENITQSALISIKTYESITFSQIVEYINKAQINLVLDLQCFKLTYSQSDFVQLYNSLLNQFEDDDGFISMIESLIKRALYLQHKGNHEKENYQGCSLRKFLSFFKIQAQRKQTQFQKALKNTCVIIQGKGEVHIKLNEEILKQLADKEGKKIPKEITELNIKDKQFIDTLTHRLIDNNDEKEIHLIVKALLQLSGQYPKILTVINIESVFIEMPSKIKNSEMSEDLAEGMAKLWLEYYCLHSDQERSIMNEMLSKLNKAMTLALEGNHQAWGIRVVNYLLSSVKIDSLKLLAKPVSAWTAPLLNHLKSQQTEEAVGLLDKLFNFYDLGKNSKLSIGMIEDDDSFEEEESERDEQDDDDEEEDEEEVLDEVVEEEEEDEEEVIDVMFDDPRRILLERPELFEQSEILGRDLVRLIQERADPHFHNQEFSQWLGMEYLGREQNQEEVNFMAQLEASVIQQMNDSKQDISDINQVIASVVKDWGIVQEEGKQENEEQKEQIEQQIEEIQEQIEENKEQIDENKEYIEEKKEYIEEIKEQIEKNKEQIDEMDEQIEEIKEQQEEIKEQIEENKTQQNEEVKQEVKYENKEKEQQKDQIKEESKEEQKAEINVGNNDNQQLKQDENKQELLQEELKDEIIEEQNLQQISLENIDKPKQEEEQEFIEEQKDQLIEQQEDSQITDEEQVNEIEGSQWLEMFSLRPSDVIAAGYDMGIVMDLPEEVRLEVLAMIPRVEEEQQPIAVNDPPAQADQDPVIIELVSMGFDEAVLQSLTNSERQDLLRNSGQSTAQAEQMDTASFIQTIDDPNLRREILLGLDENTLASLPSHLIAEYRRNREQIRQQRYQHRPNYHQEEQNEKQNTNIESDLNKILKARKFDLSSIKLDDLKQQQLCEFDEQFIKVLLKMLYTKKKCNSFSLLTHLCDNKILRYKIVTSLLFILKHQKEYEDYVINHISEFGEINSLFPPIKLIDGPLNIKCYDVVPFMVIHSLYYLMTKNKNVATFLLNGDETLEPIQQLIDVSKQIGVDIEQIIKQPPYKTIMEITNSKLFKESEQHMKELINFQTELFIRLIKKSTIINIETMQILTTILKNSTASDEIQKKIGKSISVYIANNKNEDPLLYLQKELNEKFDDEEYFLRLLKLLRIIYDKVCLSELERTELLNTEEGKQDEILQSRYDIQKIVIKILEQEQIKTQLNQSETQKNLNCFFIISSILLDFEYKPTKNDTGVVISIEENTEQPKIGFIYEFCLKRKKMVNSYFRQDHQVMMKLMHSTIIEFPRILDFDNKRTFFRQEIKNIRRNNVNNNHNYYGEGLDLMIRRDQIFTDSYQQLNYRDENEMKQKLTIQFQGEKGQDVGGLTREWFILLSREMFNPMYGLFRLSSAGNTYYPEPKSTFQQDSQRFFYFIGRIVGKALHDEYLLECYFVKSLYKMMIGQALTAADVEDFDHETYSSMKWLLDNDAESLDLNFTAESDYFGRLEVIDLIENGKNIDVTNENKHDYCQKKAFHLLYKSVEQQIQQFLKGFYELVPKKLVSLFDAKELELLISGLPHIDIEDLFENMEFGNYTPQSNQIIWLREILESYDNSELAEFLIFVTGSSKVPVDGFKAIQGMRGPQKMSIQKAFGEDFQRLPIAHTCFNQLDLPEYPTKEIMSKRLKVAITEGKGFLLV